MLEEVYYYRISPPQGFGQQLMYTNDGECTTHTVRDGDAVLLPYGYHPVVGAARATSSTTSGRWPAPSASWRCTRIRRTRGSTRRERRARGNEPSRSTIQELGVVAVIRMKDAGKLRAVVDAIAEGGVRAIEVTMTVPGAVGLIATLAPVAARRTSCSAPAPSPTRRRRAR